MKKYLWLLIAFIPASLSAQDDYNLTLPYAEKLFAQWQPEAMQTLKGGISLKTLLKESSAQPLVFYIWATWCPWCRGSVPVANALVKSGVKVIGIPLERSRADFDAYISKNKPLFDSLLLQKKGELSFASREGGFAFPYIPTFIVVYKGKAAYYTMGGEVTAEEIQEALWGVTKNNPPAK